MHHPAARLSMVTLFLLAVAVVARAEGPCDAHELAAALASTTGLEVGTCTDGFTEVLHPDLRALCGGLPGRASSFKKAVDDAMQEWSKQHDGFVAVSNWIDARDKRQTKTWWLGGASLDVVVDGKSDRAAFLTSRLYPKCGPDVPLDAAAVFAGMHGVLPVQLVPYSVPLRAWKEKIDGTVVVAVVGGIDGEPRILCIHHATPPGYGFEAPGLETVRRWKEQIGEDVALDLGDDPVTVMVEFSQTHRRRESVGAQYH